MLVLSPSPPCLCLVPCDRRPKEERLALESWSNSILITRSSPITEIALRNLCRLNGSMHKVYSITIILYKVVCSL